MCPEPPRAAPGLLLFASPILIFSCQLFRKRTVKPSKAVRKPDSLEGRIRMASLPRLSRSKENALVAPSRLELERTQKRLLTEIRDSLAATITLAVAGVLA